jgi:hypothetical protein
MFPVQLAGFADESEIAIVGTDNQERITSETKSFFIFASFSEIAYTLGC